MPNVEATPNPEPAPEIIKAKVKITRDRRGILNIDASHPIGGTRSIIAHLEDTKQRAQAYRFRDMSLDNCIDYCPDIPITAWQAAITAEIIARLTPQESHDATEVTIVSNAYLAMGNELYKLQPVGTTRTNKALSALRAKIRASAMAEAERITTDARTNSERLIALANTRVAEADRRLAAAAGAPALPPAWATANNLNLKWQPDIGRWCVGIHMLFRVEKWVADAHEAAPNSTPTNRHYCLHRKTWNALPASEVKVLIWLPLSPEGAYGITNMFLDWASPMLPHNKHSSSCLSVATTITRVDTYDRFYQLVSHIQHALRVVEIHSLLVYPNVWEQRIRAFCPANLLAHLDAGHHSSAISPIMAVTFPADRDEYIEERQEESETWQAA
jgi:hypothetical protein